MNKKTQKENQQSRQWRSLESRDIETLDQHRDEFLCKDVNELIVEPTDRRNFMGLMSASMALAGTTLSGCMRKPKEKILPYTKRPEDVIPGKPRYFATAAQVTGSVVGLLVENQDGRPTKIEGNPRHPNSVGATDTFTQASILDLYDPKRIQKPIVDGAKIPFSHLEKKIERLAANLKHNKGKGLAFLCEDRRNRVFHQLVKEFKAAYPQTKVYLHDESFPKNTLDGLSMVGVKHKRPLYHLNRAERILSLDMDFLNLEGDAVRNAHEYASKRRITKSSDKMNRLYMVEPAFSVTGMNADHRLRLAPSQIGKFLADLIGYLKSEGINGPEGTPNILDGLKKRYLAKKPSYDRFLRVLAKDLLGHRKQSLVMVGERQPAYVHAYAHLLNTMLESYGNTLNLVESSELENDGSLVDLKKATDKKEIDKLIVFGGNPLYSACGDLDFKTSFLTIPHTIVLATKENETTQFAKAIIPQSHYLESWGELIATDGTISIQQPLIAPLYESFSAIELLGRLLRKEKADGYSLVRKSWEKVFPKKDYFSVVWRRTLHDGYRRSQLKYAAPSFDWNALVNFKLKDIDSNNAPSLEQLEVVFALDPSLYDGRFANNSWLQELPDPISKLTWDNAALIGVATAKALGLKNEDLIELSNAAAKVQLPAWVVPGIADHTVILPLGYGRSTLSITDKNVGGFNVNPLRSSENPFFAQDIGLKKDIRGSYKLASTQEHGTMVEPKTGKKRPIAIDETIEGYRNFEKNRKPGQRNFAKMKAQLMPDEKLKSIYTESNNRDGQQWGMSIDLSTCLGCNACTIACQAENAISTVGKKEVLNGRELHWIRLDRYFQSPLRDHNEAEKAKHYDEGKPGVDDVEVISQPVACQQCETAPCENVCPVGATAHSPEGLNDMAYNRCIGTRYCGNNCPYKVRRFNFFNYSKRQDETHPLLAMQRNPDVTVRFRGVMEKCTYCVQRINAAKIDAKVKGNGVVRDGKIIPACQQVCPTQSIVFGDIANPRSAVARAKKQSRDYAVLADLNTKPRTTYLAKVRNPNPELG